MYDIAQLSDLLVPELLDIAEELKISNHKKMNKQDLIYNILDKQAVMSTEKTTPDGEKPKRKRIVKSEAPAEVAEVKQQEMHKKDASAARARKADVEKRPVKKAKPETQEEEELQPITDQE